MTDLQRGKRTPRVELVDPALAPAARSLKSCLRRLYPNGASSYVATGVGARSEVLASAVAGAMQSGSVLAVVLRWTASRLPRPFAPKVTGTTVLAVSWERLGEVGTPHDLCRIALDGALVHALPAPVLAGAEPLVSGILSAMRPVANLTPERAARLLAASVIEPSPYGSDDSLTGIEALALLDTIERRRTLLGSVPGFAYGVRSWNRKAIAAAFSGEGAEVVFCRNAGEAINAARRRGGRVLGWAGKVSTREEVEAAGSGVPLWRIEDGFLRSVGLGAGLARGASYAFDPLGIYFDATRASRFEQLVSGRVLSDHERRRARLLRATLVGTGLTKYNLAGGAPVPVPEGSGPLLLVPGQVADDAGVRRSRSDVIDCRTSENINLDLLRLVRTRHPGARILYKPHPDVAAGLRAGRIVDADLEGLADALVTNADLVSVLSFIDRVETFSSLAGFEALLRGLPVTVYGMPFYAGWGLTEDLTGEVRRSSGAELDTLVHAAYVDYPFCVDPVTLVPCPPEVLVRRLAALRTNRRHAVERALREKLSWFGRRIGL